MSESTGNSFFEGPEKKVELAVSSAVNLRELPRERWEEIVGAARASVLSVCSTARLDAYLLSESSLFVFDDHATMITCGRTRLVDAVLAMVDMVGEANVELLVYERKNEHFPSRQDTTFTADAARIAEVVGGQALRFGTEYAHCIEVFASDRPFTPSPGDVTLEVLMHGLDPEHAEAFRSNPPAERTAARLGLDRILPGFDIDEYAFTPAGYSLNALRGGDYYTIDVTPEHIGSYASFETNFDFRDDPAALVARVVAAFEPEAFDVLAFTPDGGHVDLESDYQQRKHVRSTVAGYAVTYLSYFSPRGIEAPLELVLPLSRP